MTPSAPTLEQVLWGDHPAPRRHARRVVGGFAVLVVACYALFALSTRPPLAGVVGPEITAWLFASVTFYGPPFAAGASTALRGGLVAVLGIGLVPAVVFGVLGTLLDLLGVTSGDAPAWVLALVFAGVGVAGALVGYGTVRVGRLAVSAWRG